MRRRSGPRLAAVTVLVALATGLLAGCTSGGANDSAGVGSGSAASNGGSRGVADAAGSSSTAKGTDAVVPSTQQVVTTGDLDLVATDPIGVAARITSIVIGAGGRIDAEEEQPSGKVTASLTVRIPAAGFATAREQIAHQGHVRTLTLHSTDVTGRTADYAARISGLRASIARLQTLLGRAGTSSELVDLESSLTTRETDLEQLQAEQRILADQVAYATLAITVTAPAVARHAPPPDFVSGFLAGLAGLLATGRVLLVALGVLLPWLVVLGALVGAGVLVRRRVRASRGADAPPDAPPPSA
ncbi:DUF4349 domain-containing protein [Amnibacterium sp. CER49]|uniref:DUF4349 domain-containing protein n=1 Tax=Amnibacterium sp. CER49 TaxID=3039161 RepID=UPI002446D9E5|nr:DUF4349 domain-containing protein [Amnibacterium sp. CER49]MDH2444262.1 DUF4349 domain-containing protein [Amnibacterium sp. CER49]